MRNGSLKEFKISTYYNEIEPFAVEWLKNLAQSGYISGGKVDNRSIAAVGTKELMGFTRCHFFAGIAGWDYALQLAGWPADMPVWTGSCPCQPFSAAGKRGGFKDDRHLWPEWFRLIRECRPPVVFGEQVASKDGLQWFDLVSADLESEGYAVGAADMCAAGIGAPHIRQRLWFVAITKTAKRWWPGSKKYTWGGLEEIGRSSITINMEDSGSARPRNSNREIADQGRGGIRLDTESLRQAHGEALSARTYTAGSTGNLADAPKRPDLTRESRPMLGEVEGKDDAVLSVAYSTCGESREPQAWDGGQGSQPGGQFVQLANPDSTGLVQRSSEPGDYGAQQSPAERSGRNPWANPEWLYCRDKKHRPTQSGICPLAHGVPGRVGQLRAYGNAIVPQVAAVFIETVMEYIGIERTQGI